MGQCFPGTPLADDDQVRGLDATAAATRRAGRPELPGELRASSVGDDERPQVFANLELRPDEMQVLVGGTRVGFTVREYQVFSVLAAREDRVLRRSEIYRQVWGVEMKRRDRAVDVFVRKVRAKSRVGRA